ncbi:MAG TPA: FAD-binding protein [Candidatus Sulfotelmatobacter sp.]|nr:FAD-binding protein [Candidatus Sulfotelmatobacter sp.]
MKGLPAETDFVVLGPSVAGLRAAIELAGAGRVLLLSKKEFPDYKTQDPKSEAAWLSDEDEVSLHLQDTLDAGDGLCNVAAVKMLLEEAPERIDELIAWGKHHGTRLTFGLENTHSKARLLHAQGESAGREILRAVWEKAQSLKHISICPFTFVTGIVTEDGRVRAVTVLDQYGVPQEIACSGVLLATGGFGQIYRNTTNPEWATADGVALAVRAGAEASDMEFVQFHPTALYMKKVPRFLLSEKLRAEGAYLRNVELDRFMAKYHPLAERAPQNLVVRAIVHEMEVSRAKDPFVYLDLTHLKASAVQRHFPRIYSAFMAHNIDITEDVIPVRPAAHYCVGGVRTDLEGKTNVAGLFAAGEVAATGVHGANRLPSNGVLEGLVFGARAGTAMREVEKAAPKGVAQQQAAYSNGPVDAGAEELIGQIQDLMWNEAGIVRTRMGMQKAIKTLEEMAPKLAQPKTRRRHEAANLHMTALLVAKSAVAREESRGSHYRMDNPDHDDKKFLKHSVVKGGTVRFV